MPAGKYLTDYVKGQIIAYHNSGKKQREIGQLINRSQTVVKNFLLKKENYGIKKPTKGNSKLTSQDKRQILWKARSKKLTSTQIKANLNVSVTSRTIRNVLSKYPNFVFGKMKSKPQLTKEHKKVRLEFARKNFSSNEFWKSVIFWMKRSSIWMVPMVSIVIGTIFEKNKNFYLNVFKEVVR